MRTGRSMRAAEMDRLKPVLLKCCRSEDRRYKRARVASRRGAGLAGGLGAAAGGGDPVEEALHAGAFAPQQDEELAGVEMRGFVAEESLHAPLNVRRGPGTQPVAPGDDPVVAESVQHGAETASGRIGAGASGR